MNQVRRSRRRSFPNHQNQILKILKLAKVVKVKKMMVNLSQKRRKLDYFMMKHSKDSLGDYPGVMMVSVSH